MGVVAAKDLWRAPHLALFVLAAMWAALVPLVWLVPGLAGAAGVWHLQEMVLGVAGAAMGGYLRLGLRSWLKPARQDRTGQMLTPVLVLAWLLGRGAGAADLPDPVALAGLCLYPAVLTAALVLPVAAAREWSRLPIALAPLLLVVIALRLRLASDSLSAVLGIALLVALVAGRIIPAFLRARTGAGADERFRLSMLAQLGDLALALAWIAHLAGLKPGWTATLLALSACGQALRMRDWPLRAGLAGGQADLAALVAAWCWLPLGLALLGAAQLGLPAPAVPTALHALTMGLMGGMILAVMSRAWMRRVPGALRVGPLLALAMICLHLATLLRLGLAAEPKAAVFCWSAGWALASVAAVAALLRPAPHPVLSASRR